MEKLGKIEYIIVHHSERTIDFPLFIKMRHMYLRHWEDIGYHYLIGGNSPFTINGKLYFGRSRELIGAHAIGYNRNSLGICLIGNFDKTNPSKNQLLTLSSFLEDKIGEYSVPIQNILGHNELPGVTKSCPGSLIDMSYIREEIAKE
jgi:N-acetylmuramoyl-L-alanine amidase